MYKVFSNIHPAEAEKRLNELAKEGYILKFCFDNGSVVTYVMEKLNAPE